MYILGGENNMSIQSEDTSYRDITRYYNKDWNIEARLIIKHLFEKIKKLKIRRL